MALVFPRSAKANVRQANRAPGKQGCETRKGDEPVKDLVARNVEVDVGEEAKDNNKDCRPEGAARLVNIGKRPRSIALLGHGGEGTGATIDTGTANGQNRDKNDKVHKVVKPDEVGVFADQDKRRGVGVTRRVLRLADEVRVGVVNQQTDKEETEDVEACKRA